MKNLKLLTVLTCLLFCSGLGATIQAQNLVNIGIKGGMNIANLNGDIFDGYDSRIGFTIGAAVDIRFPLSPVGIESGVYYSQKGVKFNESIEILGESLEFDSVFKLEYLKIPIMTKVSLGLPGPINPHLVAGPYFAYLLKGEFEDSLNGESETFDVTDELDRIDFGLIGGVGVDFNLGLTVFNIQARYSMGLLDIDEDINSQNRVFSLVAGFMF